MELYILLLRLYNKGTLEIIMWGSLRGNAIGDKVDVKGRSILLGVWQP